MKMKRQLTLQAQKPTKQLKTINTNTMCGVKLQWWADALEKDAEDNTTVIVPTQTEDKESSC